MSTKFYGLVLCNIFDWIMKLFIISSALPGRIPIGGRVNEGVVQMTTIQFFSNSVFIMGEEGQNFPNYCPRGLHTLPRTERN